MFIAKTAKYSRPYMSSLLFTDLLCPSMFHIPYVKQELIIAKRPHL